MALRNPILEAEPYEESQGDSLPSPTSPDDLKAFYSDMERQDLERKLSRSKTGSRSIWSRKSMKKSLSTELPVREFSSTNPTKPQNEKGSEEARDILDETNKKSIPIMSTSRSIIPDPLGSLPSWQSKDAWVAVPLPAYKAKYPIHNPFGPRWYKNQHLIPHSLLRPATQPLSVFSPSFPSLPPSPHERPEDQSRVPGPSRTPSGSPLPTPTSSQTGIADNGGRVRSRKTSHDTVDLLDVTDPWGTNWHHQSPYDIGLNTSSLDSEKSRPRVAATTSGQSHHKTISPSPLSQSTSALHLQPPNLDGKTAPYRKLSKRRTPVLQSLFRNHGKDSSNNAASQTHSLPAIPNRSPSPFKMDDQQRNINAGRPLSALPAPSQNRKERRTSILGRLAKRFSLLKKPAQDLGHRTGEDDNWHHISADDTANGGEVRQSISMPNRFSAGNVMSEQEKHTENVKGVPPPPPPSSTIVKGDEPNHPAYPRSSSPISLTPFPTGKLTIANPDTHEEANMGTRNGVPSSPGVKTESKPDVPLPPKEESSHPAHIPEFARSPDCPVSPPPTHIPSISTSSPQTAFPLGVDIPWTQSPIELPEIAQVPSEAVQDEKPQVKMAPLTESAVPFPVSPEPSLPEIPSLLSPPMRPLPINDSPLSTSSLFVNPPTPHVAEVPMPSDPPEVPAPPMRPNLETRRSSQDRPVRQTETFRLVRNSSGNLHSVGGTVMAVGQQWEVVEDARRRSKTKEKSSRTKDRESGTRREHRHQEKSKVDTVEANAQRRTNQTRQRSANGRNTDPPTRPSSGRRRAHSDDLRHGRGSSAPALNGNEERKLNRRRDEDRKTDRKHPDREVRPNGINFDKPQPPPPPPTPGPERRPSISARPTSELPSSAELNALRARDAWDMERLWKGRSMYEAEPNDITSSPEGATRPITGRDDSTMPTTHGSSHTSFIVQTSFQGQSPYPNIYHSMPVAPPPIVYDSASSQALHLPQHDSYNQSHHPFPTSFSLPLQDISSPSPSSRSALANPLPAPPRESSYKPAPLPATLLDSNSGRSADYWPKYAGVTAAH